MNWSGLLTIPTAEHADAGEGRRVWLAQNVQPHESLVDLGGTGGMLKPWADNVTALDDLSGFGPGQRIEADRFVRGDVQSTPFADGEFDVAVLCEVLEHVGDPVRTLREAGRVGKRVLLTTPCEMRWRNGIAFRVSGHIRFTTPEILAAQCRKAGLDGEIGLLEFGTWSFFVGNLHRV